MKDKNNHGVFLRRLMRGVNYLLIMSLISIVMTYICLVIYYLFSLSPIWSYLALILFFQGIGLYVIAFALLTYQEYKKQPFIIPIKLLPAYLRYLDAMSPENQKRERQKMKIEDQLAGLTSWTSRPFFKRKNHSDKNTDKEVRDQ